MNNVDHTPVVSTSVNTSNANAFVRELRHRNVHNRLSDDDESTRSLDAGSSSESTESSSSFSGPEQVNRSLSTVIWNTGTWLLSLPYYIVINTVTKVIDFFTSILFQDISEYFCFVVILFLHWFFS